MKPPPSPTEARFPPQPCAALVVARWHAWVRVWMPESGETTWVNLEEVGFETVPQGGSERED